VTEERVSIRGHYERFPLAIKGAFVMRGGDGNPHQVSIQDARAVELSTGDRLSLGVDSHVLEVGPTRDLFVPFELPSVDLPAGWYALELEVAIDGDPVMVRPGPRFSIAWPRASTRRGSIEVGKTVRTDAGRMRLKRIECTADSMTITYEAKSAVSLAVSADGESITVLEESFDEESGRGSTVAYPLPRNREKLAIEATGAASTLEVRLP
jgi:hypothetical protein